MLAPAYEVEGEEITDISNALFYPCLRETIVFHGMENHPEDMSVFSHLSASFLAS